MDDGSEAQLSDVEVPTSTLGNYFQPVKDEMNPERV